jgi:hypothetical protein
VELLIPGLDPAYHTRSGKIIDLRVVPPMPNSAEDPHAAFKREEWMEWAEHVAAYREQRHELTCDRIAGIDRAAQQEIELEKLHQCGTKYFMTIWASVYEARRDEAGFITDGEFKPFIPYSFQVWYLDWLDQRKRSKGAARNGWVSKSRDMGVTNCNCIDSLNEFLFKVPATIKFISRHEDLVYQRGNMDSMFERVAVHLDPESDVCLPAFMLPRGFDYGKDYRDMLLKRPGNKNTLNGASSNSSSGRGGRAGLCHVDEGAFIRGLKLLLSGLFMTTPHTIITSSESIQISDDFGEAIDRIREVCPEALIELDTWLHPFHDNQWLADTLDAYKTVDNEDAFYREVLRQRHRGLSDWIYPGARETRPLEYPVEFDPALTLIAGCDPGKADDTALGWAMVDPLPDGRDTFLEGYSNSYQLPEFYAALLLGCDPDDPELNTAFPSFRFTERERQIMEWTRHLPQPIVYGDPHGVGGSRIADRSDDWYDRMLIFSRQFNPRKAEDGRGRPLVIIKQTKNEARSHQTRHNALNDWLQRLDFSGSQGARRFHHAIANSKYEVSAASRTAEQTEPKHDPLSHMRTCAEFMACNVPTIRLSARRKRNESVELTRTERGFVRGQADTRTATDKNRENESMIDPYAGRTRRPLERVA